MQLRKGAAGPHLPSGAGVSAFPRYPASWRDKPTRPGPPPRPLRTAARSPIASATPPSSPPPPPACLTGPA